MVEKLEALNKAGWSDFSMNDKPRCPHCGDDFDIRENEEWRLYDENDSHDVECMGCHLSFRVNSHARWSFSTDEQDDD